MLLFKKKKSEAPKVVYYTNELEDDFAGSNITPIEIDENYKYIHTNIFWKIAEFIVHRIIFTLPCYIYSKVKYGLKIENRKALLNEIKNGKGVFVYQNHTQVILDPFLPTFLAFPYKGYIISNPDNISMPVLGKLNRMNGAIPVPGTIGASKNFMKAIEYYVKKGKMISIYPEAHVWPYCTQIRNFTNVSFKYPVKYNVPIFTCTTTYYKKRNKVRIKLFIDGPFYPNQEQNHKVAEKELRDIVYNTMVSRCNSENKYTEIEYIKKVDNNDN